MSLNQSNSSIPSVFGSFSHSLDQVFVAGVTSPILFDTNGESFGIVHSETVEPEHFFFSKTGVYVAIIDTSLTRLAGGGVDVVNIHPSINSGSGFVPVPNSNRKITVDSTGRLLAPSTPSVFRVNALTDVIGFHIQVEDANLILPSFPAEGLSPNELPATPSAILTLIRVGE